MSQSIGILLFDGAEELDFVGPWEAFGMAVRLGQDAQLFSIAQSERPILCAKGMRVLPDRTLDSAGELDVLLVPGGQGTRREVDNPVLIEWLRKRAARCTWVTSVCTGALLLCEAGLAEGRRVTTHWAFVEELRRRHPEVQVRDDVRYVRDGNLVTAAGVSAGIDMALWLCGQLWGIDVARKAQRAMQYDPAPPYTADV